MLSSYPKVWNLGHPAAAEVFDGPVNITEKLDGSNANCVVINGELIFKSKKARLYTEETKRNKLFQPFMNTFLKLFEEGKLKEKWIYRGESISKPKHNTLKYDRIPKGGFILFDIDIDVEKRLPYEELVKVANDLDLEVVPRFFEGEVKNKEDLMKLLETKSILGGTLVEGIVIKNYNRWGIDGKTLMAKIVRPEFVEQNMKDFKSRNPTKKDFIFMIIDRYTNENRWKKSVQHLAESGDIEYSPRDIGKLITAVKDDIREECEEEIKEALFNHFWKEYIQRGVVRGLPEWYKTWLINKQFEEKNEG